jgi:hypothetical protein
MLPFGGLIGRLVFAEVPSVATPVGAAVLVAAGLYNWHPERVRRTLEQLREQAGKQADG